jgi:hypothetical protein
MTRNSHLRRKANHRWFQLEELRQWRKRVQSKYRDATVEAIIADYPDLLKSTVPGHTVTDPSDRAHVIRLGRTGIQSEQKNETAHAMRKRIKLLNQRDAFEHNLDFLLHKKPLRRITVDDLVAEAGKPRYALYKAFKSGLPGVHCYWATKQLEALATTIQPLITIELATHTETRAVLELWVRAFSGFMLDRPHGRLPLFPYLAHELDDYGASLTARLKQSQQGSKEHKQASELLDESVELAADLHRAGARLVHTLVPIFAASSAAGRSQIALTLWGEESVDSLYWNLALSFWQLVSTSVFSVGLLEAEFESEKHRDFTFEVWYRGVLKKGT